MVGCKSVARRLGSASKAMSGTPRWKLKLDSTPALVGQAGAVSVMLGPPPVPLQAVSPPCAVVPLVASVAPLSAIAYGETAG